MSEFPLRNGAQVKSLWRAAAIILTVVFAPAALACLVMLLRH
jgi:LPS O-antigen subunit length determinant protein (WzzB/FepE family)